MVNVLPSSFEGDATFMMPQEYCYFQGSQGILEKWLKQNEIFDELNPSEGRILYHDINPVPLLNLFGLIYRSITREPVIFQALGKYLLGSQMKLTYEDYIEELQWATLCLTMDTLFANTLMVAKKFKTQRLQGLVRIPTIMVPMYIADLLSHFGPTERAKGY